MKALQGFSNAVKRRFAFVMGPDLTITLSSHVVYAESYASTCEQSRRPKMPMPCTKSFMCGVGGRPG